MTPEELIIQKALEQGIIQQQDLDTLAREATLHGQDGKSTWGVKIDWLMQKGLLDKLFVEKMSAEIAQEQNRATKVVNVTEQGIQKTSDLSGSTSSPAISMAPHSRLTAGSRIDVYEVVRLLGEGGMGQVYLAFNSVLKRHVALKILRVQDHKMVERFFREAQLQAQVEHANVCQVYGMGETEERPYIAMQFIDGQTLNRAAQEMSLEQKLKVIKEVAYAVHAAHRQGLIHRDIKPENIMIERTESGGWKPFVLDFGLAREQMAPGMTATGMVMGTPHYISPEQARGGIHSSLDRRTDVYSLGATLYELIAGQPVFDGASGLDVLLQVLNKEPVSLRKIVETTPSDIETIVMKCLEKEPQRRYDSARALAKDLQRYLDGEPISARKASFLYVLKKKARKNKLVISIAVGALSLLFLLAAFSIQAQLSARERVKLAQQFGHQIKEIEDIMRFEHMMPRHNISNAKAMIHSRITAIATQIEKIGNLAEGPGYYALGRGYLSLNDFYLARDYLLKAWAQGYRTPESSYSAGLVLGALYQRELQVVERIQHREFRADRRQEIEKQYREPALQLLRQSSSANQGSLDYVKALIAFYEKNYAEALQKLQNAHRQIPWFYETKKLEGDIHIVLGFAHQEMGKFENAFDEYQAALEAYVQAANIGRSDPGVYEGFGNLWLMLMIMEMSQWGEEVLTYFNQGILACDNVLEVNSESFLAFQLRSGLYTRRGEHELKHGQDPTDSLNKAIEAGQQSLSLRPEEVEVANNIGIAYKLLASYDLSRGDDPTSNLQRAIEIYQNAIKINPNYAYTYYNIGDSYISYIEHLLGRGIAPQKSIDGARQAFQKAIELNPNNTGFLNTMGLTYLHQATHELSRGADPRPSLENAITAFQKATDVNPRNADTKTNIGRAYNIQANFEILIGKNLAQSVRHALKILNEALTINPNFGYAHYQMASVYLTLARSELEQGLNPTQTLQRGIQSLKKALDINPNHGQFHCLRGKLKLLEGQFLMKRGQNPDRVLGQASSALKKAINLKSAEAYHAMALLYRWWAAWKVIQNHDPDQSIRQGLLMVNATLDINPNMAEVRAIQGVLLLLKSMDEADLTQRESLLQDAGKALQKALTMNKNLAHEYTPSVAQINHLLEQSKVKPNSEDTP
ncbi:protein kinase [candidate division CSSED10-310 bacterium]|uniref:Protein kinase n=1 Tax=candidate division CSSED10-310 bacterium TaxID=2855610 RepID=A0ABV6Z549_UNCC1